MSHFLRVLLHRFVFALVGMLVASPSQPSAQVLPQRHDVKLALYRLDTNVPTGSQPITWDTSSYDELGWQFFFGLPGVFQVPAGSGVTHVRVRVQAALDTAQQGLELQVRHNSLLLSPGVSVTKASAGSPDEDALDIDVIAAESAWIEVSEGDFFETRVAGADGGDVAAGSQSWILLEARIPATAPTPSQTVFDPRASYPWVSYFWDFNTISESLFAGIDASPGNVASTFGDWTPVEHNAAGCTNAIAGVSIPNHQPNGYLRLAVLGFDGGTGCGLHTSLFATSRSGFGSGPNEMFVFEDGTVARYGTRFSWNSPAASATLFGLRSNPGVPGFSGIDPTTLTPESGGNGAFFYNAGGSDSLRFRVLRAGAATHDIEVLSGVAPSAYREVGFEIQVADAGTGTGMIRVFSEGVEVASVTDGLPGTSFQPNAPLSPVVAHTMGFDGDTSGNPFGELSGAIFDYLGIAISRSSSLGGNFNPSSQ